MGTTIQEFAAQCHAALKADPGTEGRKKIRDLEIPVVRGLM